MLTELLLKNFKAWPDTGTVALAPVTLLLGANSSGKSSLLQSLLLLKQTVMSPDRTIHLNLGGDEVNDYFSFGAFDDVLTANADERFFDIGLQMQSVTKTGTKSPITKEYSFLARYGMTTSGPAVRQMSLSAEQAKFRALRRERGAYSLYVNDEEQPRGKSRSYTPERSIAFSAEAVAALGLDGAKVQDISLALRRELENIIYLGPLRCKPERDYPWNKTRPGDLGNDGGNVANVLMASALLKASDSEERVIVKRVSQWLARMGLAESLEVRQLGRSTRYEVVVMRDGVTANLRDVGIGVSQVLPVLTLAYFAPSGSTVILEEPEIHLHPLAQSVLAELFVEANRERQVQFLVETHSEHLFRRMQTLMAGNKTDADQCRMYFVEKADKGASLRNLEVDEYGRLHNWPEKFFGDALGETREQARLMFERQQQGPSR